MNRKTESMSRRRFLQLAGVMAASGALAACAPQPSAPEGGEEPAPPPAEKVKLTWWSHTHKPWNDELTRQADVYNAENDDVEVEYVIYPGEELLTKLTIALQGGTGPDIMGVHSYMIPQLIAGDQVIEVPDWVAADIEKRFYPIAIDGATFNGKIWGYNQHIGGRMMIANVGMFEENNIDLPESWQDMVDATEVLDKEEDGVLVQSVANYSYGMENLYASWGSILFSQGGKDFTDDLSAAAFNDDIGREATEIYMKFVHPEMGADTFYLGKTAVIEGGPWMREPIETNAPDVTFKALPVLKGSEGRVQCDYVWNWLVNKATEPNGQDAAWKFTNWLNSTDNQVSMYQASSLMPTTMESREDPRLADDEWGKTFIGELEYKHQYVAKLNNWSEIERTMSDEFSLLATGEQSIEETLDKAEAAVNVLLEAAEVLL